MTRRLKSVFIALLLPCSAAAQGLSSRPEGRSNWSPAAEWETEAWLRAQLNFQIDQKPSSVRGRSRTDWGSLEFAAVAHHLESPFEVALAGSVGPERDPNHGETYPRWDELRLTWKHKPELSFGLLVDPVVAFDAQEWGFNSLGPEFRPAARRWGILPASDAGFQWSQGTSIGHWVFQATNGEGWPQSETGVRKDFELVWTQPFMLAESVARIQAFYRWGEYELLPPDRDTKTRAGLQAAWRADRLGVGFLAMTFEDPVDAVNGALFEGVDLSAKGGEMNRGTLSEGWVRIGWGERREWSAFVRLTDLRVDADDREKDIGSAVAGLGRSFGAGMDAHLLFQQVAFGERHSALAEDRQSWFLAWSWSLEKPRHP